MVHTSICVSQSSCRAAHGHLTPSSRHLPGLHAAPATPHGVLSRARLPHMDEEIEHMQWQLDQRSHDPSVVSIVAGGSSTRHTKARKQRLVFRDTSSSQRQSRRLHLRHHQHTHGSGGSSSADESAASQSTVAGAATTAARDSADATSQQFYCLQLDPHAAAAQDLHKAQERLAKHMQKDGGCCVSAPLGQASTLTHLMLLLQHKQLHRKSAALSGRSSSDTLLLLQPLSCHDTTAPSAASSSTPASSFTSTAAGAMQDAMQASPAPPSSNRQHTTSTVLRPGAGVLSHMLDCACPVEELQFFATFMPLQTLLSVEHSRSHAGAGADVGAAQQQEQQHGHMPHAGSLWTWDATDGSQDSSGSASGSSSILQSLWPAESSAEEVAAASTTTPTITSSVSHGTRHSQHSKSMRELLKAAGSNSGSSSMAALLVDAANRGRSHTIHVGLHADPAGIAARVVSAAVAGDVLALHVRDQPAAHAVAYAALALANEALSEYQQQQHAQQQQQAQHTVGFGVLLVQGHSHEHVHARTHGHSSNSINTGSGNAAAVGSAAAQHTVGSGAAAAADGTVPHQHAHHHTKVVSDASMDVGGFGAAFYGIGGAGAERRQQQHEQAVLHKHGQEVWLCVVPLSMS